MLREIVKYLLDEADRHISERERKLCSIESDGYRLVDADQTTGYDSDGKCEWEVRDYRTREILAKGRDDSYQGMDAAWQSDWHDINTPDGDDDWTELYPKPEHFSSVPDCIFAALSEAVDTALGRPDESTIRAWAVI